MENNHCISVMVLMALIVQIVVVSLVGGYRRSEGHVTSIFRLDISYQSAIHLSDTGEERLKGNID
jgi:hypothetical protein